jgi:hypothetical protein
MNKLELEWETFDFYTAKIQKQESVHMTKMSLIKSFLSKKYNFSEDKKLELLKDYNNCCKALLLLYKKQVDSLTNLIQLNKNIVDVPLEREVDTQTLIELKNTTSTLIMQVHEHKKDMESMLGLDEDFSN